MVMAYYSIILALSLGCCTFYYWKMRKYYSVLYTLVFVLAFLSQLCYVLLAFAQNEAEALTINKFLYIGGCYLPLVGLLLVFSVCKINLPKWVHFLMLVFSTFIFGLVLSSGNNQLFYKSVDIEVRGGVTVLVKEYGPLHILYYIEIGIYLAATFFALFYGWFKKTAVSRRNLAIAAFMQIFSIFAFFVGRAITKEIEWMALADLVDEIGFLLIVDSIGLYRVDDLVSSSILKEGQFGYVSLDYKKRYLSATEVAKRFLPELAKNHADRPIEDDNLRELFERWIDEFKRKNVSRNHTYRRDKFIYLIRVGDLYDGKKKRGYLIEITDDTEHQQHMEGIERYNRNLNKELTEKTKLIRELRNKLKQP